MSEINAAAPRQHGVKGVYLGGEWVDIEDCGEKFHIKNGSDCLNKGDCKTCPRSRSRKSSAKADGSYDVIVIGAGCIGAAIARELSKSAISVLWLECADDVTQGATKGNSGIVHAGFDDVPNTNRSKYCWSGNQMFAALDRELHFGYQKNGSLVLASSEEEMKHLVELKKRGETNGVERLRIIDKEELFRIEPHCNPNCIAALLSPDAGNLIPYEYTIALAENAVDNGVELRIRREVKAIEDTAGMFTVTARYWEPSVYASAMGLGEEGGASQTSIRLLTAFTIFVSALSLCMQQIHALEAALAAYTPWLLPLLSAHLPVPTHDFLLHALAAVACSLPAALVYMLQAPNRKAFSKALPPVGSGGRIVNVDEMRYGGSGSSSMMEGVTVATEQYRARFIINAAGSGSDGIAKMVGDESFKIKPRLGDYLLLNRDQGHLARHTLFPCPGPLGKGVLVQTTLWGNCILGPTARDMHLPEVAAETPEDIQRFILSKCKALVPSFDPRKVIHAFCGSRAKSTRGDWIIEASAANPRMIHAAGIDSPGLAGSPAIALEIVSLLRAAGQELPKNPTFNPNRAPIILPKDGMKSTLGSLKYAVDPAQASKDMRQNVVCKCEKTTEYEVVTALHRSLPIDSTQAIRKRTRAGMGHCQSAVDNYNCECRVADIIARELDVPAGAVGRRPWPASSTLSERWIGDKEKDKLQMLMGSS